MGGSFDGLRKKGVAAAALSGLAGLALSKGKKKPDPAPTAATGNMAAM